MAVYSLPWDRQEQIKVCVALRNHSFVSFTEKDELEKIERNIQYADLSEPEKLYLEKMIDQYGSNIDI
ncbi:hypothetical protein NMSP_1260 [Candidatus Nitrosomarinus catalina]|uniref:Uncharacterized protein n=1 Tax=Candidatus Nitrosomarinus catalinensis TaxID=1898749 RepID=A0A2Z2HMB6_9ARCH|nr:hypothetical protein [Candidatus Nitrosomarinus catalina]ARS64875.1 hypothetical protein NMSP_1260 [Candidatus Nitrosomarinus catalina]